METTVRYNRRRSGYEPSDTETEWHESPTPVNGRKVEVINGSSPAPRRRSKSPYKPARGAAVLANGNAADCHFSQSERRTINPDHQTISPLRRHVSPFKAQVDAHDVSWGRSERGSSYSRRAASAPRSRLMKVQTSSIKMNDHKHGGLPSVGELNEMVANAKISKMSSNNFDLSIDSIFFSRDYNNNNNNSNQKDDGDADIPPAKTLPKPPGFVGRNGGILLSSQTTSRSSGVSRQSSGISESSGRTSSSTSRFVESRRKQSQSDSWFFCINKGSCKTSHKSPKKERPFDEASFIGKAVVVESLRPFWADKHQPVSFIGFNCHKNEAQLLHQLASSSDQILPHILLKGPCGSGKKALTMALLREIFGDPVWNISHDLKYFHILESRPVQVVVPVSSSPHHVELNVYLETKAAYALTALVKQISSEHALPPEISVLAPTNTDYKVLVLYDVDKAPENIQHLIKWIMDCYSDSCKLILCCEDDLDILESVKSRCKVIHVQAPPTHQVMEVLIQIAKKEGFELPMSFAAKIANKSKQNLRRAIMALEACKLHNYPFTEDQPIPLGWEEAVVELAAQTLADPFPKRLFMIRGKIQKLLGDFVHPKLILLKLVQQFLRGVDATLKREIYYWYAYYDKRLPGGTNALLKLEEFVAKFMSIYRKSSSTRQS